MLVNSFRGDRVRRDQCAVPVGTVPQYVQELDQYRIMARMINRRVKLSVALAPRRGRHYSPTPPRPLPASGTDRLTYTVERPRPQRLGPSLGALPKEPETPQLTTARQ